MSIYWKVIMIFLSNEETRVSIISGIKLCENFPLCALQHPRFWVLFFLLFVCLIFVFCFNTGYIFPSSSVSMFPRIGLQGSRNVVATLKEKISIWKHMTWGIVWAQHVPPQNYMFQLYKVRHTEQQSKLNKAFTIQILCLSSLPVTKS